MRVEFLLYEDISTSLTNSKSVIISQQESIRGGNQLTSQEKETMTTGIQA
jgi:hypothetical protein